MGRSPVPRNPAVKYFPRALRYLKPYVRLAVVSVALIGLGVLVSLLVPWPLALIVDYVLGGRPLPGWLDAVIGLRPDTRARAIVLFALGSFVLVLVQNAVT